MSKRYFPQQHGDRKRAKLNISVSDHNFPLSQNNEPAQENWGDDNEDEILLLASQACEEAYNANDSSFIPDYNLCMNPGKTSTQMFPLPGPSTSNMDHFKKPSNLPSSIISSHLKEKCNRISSPLPGITDKISRQELNSSDDYLFNDKVCKGQDVHYNYRQLLQLQEDNQKLKSENGKLLEKCVTKEGEASILRTQLKTCQVTVDNARLDKIKAQEKLQVEWMEKLAMANNQLSDLKNQLDFKNLEIISIKEKCKKLESTKLRMTQVTLANNDISSSYRHNNIMQNDSITQHRRVKTTSSAAQTENKAHFLTLNKISRPETISIAPLLPYILEPSVAPHSLLDYNEKLTRATISNKCRVYSTFHRVPSTTTEHKDRKESVTLPAIYEDITRIATGCGDTERYFNVFKAVNKALTEVQERLETISLQMMTAFQKEMDEKYMEATSRFICVTKEDLLKGKALYKEEQEIESRRVAAVFCYILEAPEGLDMFQYYENNLQRKGCFLVCAEKICSLIEKTSTATLYSSFLLSLIYIIQVLLNSSEQLKTIEIVKTVVISRPMPFVICELLSLMRKMALWEQFKRQFCPGGGAGNLKMDYDQGVLLYKKDSCYLQIVLKQTEASLKCIESQELVNKAAETTTQLILLFTNINCDATTTSFAPDKTRCDCHLVLVQIIVYALRICAVMLDGRQSNDNEGLMSTCRCGLQLLYQCALRDVEFSSQLSHNEGHLIHFCEIMRTYQHSELYANMLTELVGTLQSTPEDMPPSFHRQPWLKSFETFSLAD